VPVQREHGDVILGGGVSHQGAHDRRAGVFGEWHGPAVAAGGGGGQLAQGGRDMADPVVDRLVAALYQAVGEAAQQRARRDDDGRGMARGVVGGADRRVGLDGEHPGRVPGRGGEHRREVAGGGEHELAGSRVIPAVQHGGHRVGLEVLDLVVQHAQRLRGIGRLQDVGAQGGAHASHDDRGGQPGAGHVADDDAEFPVGQREHVVPVAADVAGPGDVAGRQARAGHVGQRVRQQAAVQRHRGQGVVLRHQGVQGAGGPVGGELEQLDVGLAERPAGQGADVQHPDDVAAGEQGHAEQGLDAAVDQQRVAPCQRGAAS
jgi:hypothetical protein